jgi:hypothetical protein
MSLQDLKDLYLPPSAHEIQHRDGLTIRTRATMKHHRHNHKLVWLPVRASVSPAEYRRRHLGRQ